ncbi:MAG: endonuclease/exonuclease/phosphatase family protein [Acidobacteriota bacterium]|nr:MAG: endonuclease/exonuclease/phosphatase family protein [Acidobacteriota bacterium]
MIALLWPPASIGSAQTAPEIRVMSFNIRYGTANDGENRWENRREFLIETIRAFDPDLLGTQETLGFQRDFIAERLSGYENLGVGRDDGGEKGEMTALFFRKSRFEKLDGGHFWLSEKPDVPGSKSWDTSLTRMATWVRLRDKRRPSARPIVFINTHFDHRGAQARLESARLLRARATEWSRANRIILTGDFNAGAGSPPYQALFDSSSPVIDTWRSVNPSAGSDEGTFSGFRPESTSGPRIDWIAVSRDWKIVSATIDRTVRDGRTPSDHFPVSAVLSGP